MSKWTKTPFTDLEAARLFALQTNLEPSEVIEFGGTRSFYVGSGNKTMLVAQPVDGGEVRERKLNTGVERKKVIQYIYYRGKKPARIGSWEKTSYTSLEELIEEKGPSDMKLLIYTEGENELHYKSSTEGVLVRELTLSSTS